MKKKTANWKLWGAMFAIAIFGCIFLLIKINRYEQKIEFNGIVEQQLIDRRGYPNVLVKGKQFQLLGAKNIEILVGDSLVKEVNSAEVRCYRNGKLIAQFSF